MATGVLGGVAAMIGLILAAPAHAANMPQVGPVPAWIKPAPVVPEERADVKGLPLVSLLNDVQLSFDADGWTEYHNIEVKVQTALGLQGLGAVPFQWAPWGDTLTFHHVNILRDGQVIDVLPKDGVFTVLRRETNLEQAMLTGELTALLQPEGLQVGDVLQITVSIRHAAPLLKGRPGAFLPVSDAMPVGRTRLEAHWPASLPVKWRETAGLPAFVRREADGVTTISLSVDDMRPPIPPAKAPPRFQHGRQVEFSTFPDWNGVAQLIAPLFAKAAELKAGSAVAAQAKAIADKSPDPKLRAAAALQLVQGEVRYLAHVDAEGDYTPQTADDTWRLRYGDCKAKTVLLIALLKELGIQAEPVLVSTTGGDGLDAHLPNLLFDHVLVRMKLGGRDYWLDGARIGDRNLDDLAIPAYGWVLPLGSADARLVHIGPAPLSVPQVLQVIRYDASGGVTKPEPTQLKTIFRGDVAVQIHAQLSAVAPDRLDAALKTYWAGVHTAFTADHVATAWDPATGVEILSADGASKLDWSGSGLELQHVALGGAPDIKRDPQSSDPDAPYTIGYPSYVETDESVVLPPDDTIPAGALKAIDIDTVIGGTAYHRAASVDGRVFSVVASQRSLKPEISAVEARAAVDPLTKLGEAAVYAPAGPQKQAADDAAALDNHAETADAHLNRAGVLMRNTQYKEARVEVDAAIALDPKSQRAWSSRALLDAWSGDPAAVADADKADTLGPTDFATLCARALMATHQDDLSTARNAYRKALALEPNQAFVLANLVNVEVETGDFNAARRDVAELVRIDPSRAGGAHMAVAAIEQGLHHKEAAERELALAPATTSEAHLARARLYHKLGDTDRARADVDAAMKIEPTMEARLLRASIDGGFDSAAAIADVDAALKADPGDLNAQLWKVNAATHRQDYATALQMMNGIVERFPDAAGNLLVGRAQIEDRLGQDAARDADLTRARALAGALAPQADVLCRAEMAAPWKPELSLADCQRAQAERPTSVEFQLDIAVLLHRLGREAEADRVYDSLDVSTAKASELNAICYSLAAENLHLDRALADCDASLKARPGDAPALESRAFVLMRLGRYAEALAAYNLAVAAAPKDAHPLYCRGLVEAKLGMSAESIRDVTAATALNSRVRQDFAKIGVG